MSGVISLSELIARLLQPPTNGGLTPSENISELLRQAERWLRLIKSVDFRSTSSSARQELRYGYWHQTDITFILSMTRLFAVSDFRLQYSFLPTL